MKKDGFHHVYGPVPSRRLGRSLGVDLVPFKTCSYDCIYCQLGRTTDRTAERKDYFDVAEIISEVEKKLSGGAAPDYITLAGSGEPTLHSGIGMLIRGLKAVTATPIVVLTNGSLLWRSDVREDLLAADIVIPSLDAGDESLFQYVNRPHKKINFEQMVDGTIEFTRKFSGEVRLEVLLLDGVTAVSPEAEKIAALARRIQPARIELNTVCRPPGEDFAFPVPGERMTALKTLFDGPVDVIGAGGKSFSASDAPGADNDGEILALIGRRPCTAGDTAAGLGLHQAEALKALERLCAAGRARRVTAGQKTFYAAGPGEENKP